MATIGVEELLNAIRTGSPIDLGALDRDLDFEAGGADPAYASRLVDADDLRSAIIGATGEDP